MIKIKVSYDGIYVTAFKVTGHANYDDYGHDIVCASVSTLVITSINVALRLDGNSVDVIQKEGLIDAKILKLDDVINKVFINMIDMLKELETNYKDNVKII